MGESLMTGSAMASGHPAPSIRRSRLRRPTGSITCPEAKSRGVREVLFARRLCRSVGECGAGYGWVYNGGWNNCEAMVTGCWAGTDAASLESWE